MNFFDRYPRFYQTGMVGAAPNRLNSRHRALIEANLDCIQGSSILDLASHDGRWSFAALKAGARHLLGIEAQAHLTETARETFRAYEIAPDAFCFATDDIYNRLPNIPVSSIDTVFCFGFLYHTMHHQMLLSMISRLRPKFLILDSCVSASADAIIEVKTEKTPAATAPMPTMSVVGYPSRRALEMMLENCGFRARYVDWREMHIRDWSGIEDYRDGVRVTLRADFCG